MKIGIVIDSWNGGNGGIIATKRLVSELLDRGHEVRVIATGEHKSSGNFKFFHMDGFTLPMVKESLEQMEMLFGKGDKEVYRKAFKGLDIVQIQFPMFMAPNAVKVAKSMDIAVVGACHIQPQNIISAMGKENPLMEKIIHFAFNFFLFNRVDALHAPSTFAAKLYKNHKSRAHFRVISNGIPHEYIPANKEKPKEFGKKFVILNIGRHALEKRQELLIKAVAKSKYQNDIQLVLSGKGEDTEKLIEMGKLLSVEPIIEYVSAEDKITYLQTADLYVHPSIVELESLSCLEAIGCGLPCMISNSTYSAAPQFALDERFLFKMDDVDSLKEQIDYWYENREELSLLKITTLNLAKHYRMEKCITEMETFYSEAITHSLEKKEISGDLLAVQKGFYLDDIIALS